MFSRLFIAALWSPTGKGLTFWLLFVTYNYVFVTFPCGFLDQVWYLIVSIPDLFRHSYFATLFKGLPVKISIKWCISISIPEDCLILPNAALRGISSGSSLFAKVPDNAVFHLGLHYLPKYLFKGFQNENGKYSRFFACMENGISNDEAVWSGFPMIENTCIIYS